MKSVFFYFYVNLGCLKKGFLLCFFLFLCKSGFAKKKGFLFVLFLFLYKSGSPKRGFFLYCFYFIVNLGCLKKCFLLCFLFLCKS